jgi:hypothetical protein
MLSAAQCVFNNATQGKWQMANRNSGGELVVVCGVYVHEDFEVESRIVFRIAGHHHHHPRTRFPSPIAIAIADRNREENFGI